MSEKKDDTDDTRHLWRPVDPGIWSPGPATPTARKVVRRVLGVFSSFPFLLLLGTSVIPLSFILSIATAYSVGGTRFFGPILVVFWSAIVVAAVVVLEKKGYARHFESWEFPLNLNRVMGLAVAFLVALLIMFGIYLRVRSAGLLPP